jgi:hypothetical protein
LNINVTRVTPCQLRFSNISSVFQNFAFQCHSTKAYTFSVTFFKRTKDLIEIPSMYAHCNIQFTRVTSCQLRFSNISGFFRDHSFSRGISYKNSVWFVRTIRTWQRIPHMCPLFRLVQIVQSPCQRL